MTDNDLQLPIYVYTVLQSSTQKTKDWATREKNIFTLFNMITYIVINIDDGF